jgi:transposase
MEDVLDVYHRPLSAEFPQVCIDETSKQLLEHVNPPLPPRPGTLRRVDDEYRRCGTTNIFLAVEPLTGKVITKPTDRRTAIDFAHFLRDLADKVYPAAKRIVAVMDNLSTHTLAAFYEAFEPAEARRLATKFEIHFTPKHGSWLNMAEVQLSVLSLQALDQRIASMPDLRRVLGAWHRQRTSKPLRWRFTTSDARIKLRRLYPDLERAAAGVGGTSRSSLRRAGAAAASDP